jgi:inorganic pyrophosphatase
VRVLYHPLAACSELECRRAAPESASLDRTLFTATQYPAGYGFIEGSLGADGDPLDALVLVQEPTFPTCLIRCRTISMFCMRDEGWRRQGALRATDDLRTEHLRDIHHLDEFHKLDPALIEVYKALEPGKALRAPTGWGETRRRRRSGSPGIEPAMRVGTATCRPIMAPDGQLRLAGHRRLYDDPTLSNAFSIKINTAERRQQLGVGWGRVSQKLRGPRYESRIGLPESANHAAAAVSPQLGDLIFGG